MHAGIGGYEKIKIVNKILIMKTLQFLIAICVLCFAAVSCERSCDYDKEYNSRKLKCECIQEWDSDDAPALSHNDYNTCYTVLSHFYYASVGNKDYPYYSHEGDTIMCCGYANKIYYAENGAWAQISMSDDSLAQSGIIWLEVDSLRLHSIDIRQKCFVKGTLSFGINTSHFTWWVFNATSPHSCISPELLLNIHEICN